MKQQKRSQSASPAVENLKKDSNSCPNCGQSFFSHNDDGSCVEDSNMEDLRTKGEWEAITWGRLIVACGKYFITDAPKIVICDMNQNLPEAEANAAYIVEAVNNHEKLKAENESIKKFLESLTPGGSEFHNDPVRCFSIIKEQIQSSTSSLTKIISNLKAENAKLAASNLELLAAAEDTLKWLEENHRAKEPHFFENLKTAIHNANK